ncbi:AAA family ATPase [Oscillospiraceae bacterium OttesenSCG-928-G22]|nr:AAA family ATPase [Oscillospiraceae bacterium OttesenSCG-928-G22]
MKQAIYLITGVMASGKTTISECLASRIDRCVHVRGDVFRKMVVSGRSDMSDAPSDEAIRQLYLRYRLAAETAINYYSEGFSVVLQDNYYGDALSYMMERFEGCPVNVIVLCPNVETVRERESRREKTGYTGFHVEGLYREFMKTTPKIGLWLDTSDMTPDESVDAILAHYAG